MKQSCQLPLLISQITNQWQGQHKMAHSYKFRWTIIQQSSKTLHEHQANTGTKPSSAQPIKESIKSDLTAMETTENITPKTLTADRHEALLEMQKRDPFCTCISRWLSNGKAPQHKANLFTPINGLLYKHVMNA